MFFDWAAILDEVVALAIVWGPVEAVVLLILRLIYQKTNKAAASLEMMPDLNLEQRKFVKWWAEDSLRKEMETQSELHPAEPWKQ